MGKDLYEGSEAARTVYDTADRVLGYALSRICFEGPEDTLRRTEYTQPAIFATSLACLSAAVESGRITARPGFMAGHSLGEYTALVAAGALTLEDGLTLLAERARLMAEAGQTTEGTLAAILGLEEAVVRAICEEADVDVCNLNLPTQTVIGGSVPGVAQAMVIAKDRGATRVQALNVSGAFHSRLMRPAAEGLATTIASTPIQAPVVAVIANASATVLDAEAAVRAELAAQIASPVYWHQSVTLMSAQGARSYVEFGPGRVLTGLVKRLLRNAELANINSLQDATNQTSSLAG